MSKRDRHGNDQYYMASSQRPAHTAECRILLGLVCSSTRLHGVTDPTKGLCARSQVGELLPGAVLALRRGGRQKTVINLFFL